MSLDSSLEQFAKKGAGHEQWTFQKFKSKEILTILKNEKLPSI